MKINDILGGKERRMITVTPDQSVREAIDILVGNRIGALLVMEGEDVKGIITERDILRECGRNPDALGTVPVRSAMSSDLVICHPDDEIQHVMSVMTQKHIRHVPVLDGKTVTGMISIGDVVKSQLREMDSEIRYLKDYISGTRF